MTAVGAQAGLFEPEPPRSVNAPGAHGWWGVDTATSHYVIGTVDRDLKRTSDLVLNGGIGSCNGERMARYEQQLDALVVAMLEAGRPVPGVAWVEQASGQHPKPELVYAVGAAVSALYRVLRRELGYPVLVETVPSATWKSKLAPGGGGWYKTERVPGRKTPRQLPLEEYKVLQWARANGYKDTPTIVHGGRTVQVAWDHADARGQAEGARRTFALR